MISVLLGRLGTVHFISMISNSSFKQVLNSPGSSSAISLLWQVSYAKQDLYSEVGATSLDLLIAGGLAK